MTAIITNKFRLHNAETFIAGFSTDLTDRNMYLFIGRSKPWDDDTAPTTPSDTVQQEFNDWDEMLALKRITQTSVSNVIPRFDWATNTKYVPYDPDDADLLNHPTSAEVIAATSIGYLAGSFYTITDDYNVYKCLENKSNTVSTIKPTGTSTSSFQTADGYVWKYMFSIGVADILKYVTRDWIPVKKIASNDGSFQWAVQSAAIDGAIEAIKILDVGSSYTDTLINNAVVSATSGTITLAAPANNSTNNIYTGATIYIEVGGTGGGQSRVISAYSAASRVVTVTPNWSVVPDATSVASILPSVVITGDGSGAAARVTVSSGQIATIAVTANGSGYRNVSAVIQGCGGINGTCKAIVSPKGGHGADAPKELGGFFVMMNVKLQYSEGSGDFPITNDYRRLGIVRNILNIDGTTISTATTLRASKTLSLATVSGTFQPDELIISNGTGAPSGYVIESTNTGGATAVVGFYQNLTSGYTAFGTSQTVTGQLSGATGVISAINNSEVTKNSGDVIFVEQRRPIMRSVDQLEDIKLIAEF